MSALEQILVYSGDSESESEAEPYIAVPVKRGDVRAKAKRSRKEGHAVILKDCQCILKCNLSKDRRMAINEYFWSLPMKDQRLFIRTYSSRCKIKRRRVKRNLDDSGYKKCYTFKYCLQSDDGAEIDVCASYFLNTLGYNEKSNSVIYRAYKAADKDELGGESSEKESGRHNPLMEAVKQDIFSYHPTTSHYRREHAPNVLYLPADLSCVKMHASFNENRTSAGKESCSYNYYYKILARLKIRFTKLGHELCEKCRVAEIHFKSSGHRSDQKEEQDFRQAGVEVDSQEQSDGGECSEQSYVEESDDEATCKVCASWLQHRNAAVASRVEYDKDKGNLGDMVVSVDLEKVIQLPCMERFKDVVFAKRIVALNETFAPLGGGQNGPVHAVLWNETISGRKAPDIMSTFTKHLECNPAAKRVIYWLDNCAAQNKNWDLMLHMTLLVNSTWVSANQITFKYLESGHTFMSADVFHASVERQMKNYEGGELQDFDDFVKCVQRASSEPPAIVTVMKYSDFWEPTITFKPSVFHKKKIRPYLANIKVIRFVRGNYHLQYKEQFDGPWLKAEIFTKKQLKEVCSHSFKLQDTVLRRTENRGIERNRKENIVMKICPLMLPEKAEYWKNLEERDQTEEF